MLGHRRRDDKKPYAEGASRLRFCLALRSLHFCSLSSNRCAFFFCLFVPIPGLILRTDPGTKAASPDETHSAV
jgi:hypothetical protein